MRFPDGLDPASFLKTHWQKQPLFMRGAFADVEPELDPDELAWLATQPDVESRLVFTEHRDNRLHYSVRHGPFDDKELMELPDRDWTLLVQDVDKHLPDFRDFFRRCDFVPDWRIDDLMISFAAPGGSVGPHRDNYDVFLVQGTGQREWRVAIDEGVTADQNNSELSLLQPFGGDQRYVAERSDVLYLPPGAPHWGVAQDRCVTYSIGMRAPELAEFSSAAERMLPNRVATDFDSNRDADAHRIFYEDPDLNIAEAGPGLIAARSLQRARDRFDADFRFNDDEFANIFGSLVTDPKAWLEPERPNAAALRQIRKQLQHQAEFHMHGMARVAYSTGSDNLRVFANGFSLLSPLSAGPQISNLCAQRGLNGTDIAYWRGNAELSGILDWLVLHGVFDIGDG